MDCGLWTGYWVLGVLWHPFGHISYHLSGLELAACKSVAEPVAAESVVALISIPHPSESPPFERLALIYDALFALTAPVIKAEGAVVPSQGLTILMLIL